MARDPRIVCRHLPDDCQGRVRRSIVNNNHLDVLIALIQYGLERSSNEPFTIANWNHDTDQAVDITTLPRGIRTHVFFAGVRVGGVNGPLYVIHTGRSRTDPFNTRGIVTPDTASWRLSHRASDC